jgi:hypothetical protein
MENNGSLIWGLLEYDFAMGASPRRPSATMQIGKELIKE